MKKDCMHIAQFGAFHFESLGDTMFPVIFNIEMKKRFPEGIQIDLYSLDRAEEFYNGLSKVHAIDSLAKQHKENPYQAFIIGGGEIVHFSDIAYQAANGENKIIPAGELWQKPQKMAQQLGIPVMWNCVGVSGNFENEREVRHIQEACCSLQYLSVRDEYSRLRLERMAGIKYVHKVPDMLWKVNQHIKKEHLNMHLNELKKKYAFLKKKYLVLQYGTSWKYQQVAQTVLEIARDNQLVPVLLVVNYCHEDKDVASKIMREYQGFCYIDQKLQPMEIMSVISGASFFLGTSLHGNIIAASYGIRHLCLDMYPSFVSKLDGLFEMLHMETLIVHDPDTLLYKFSKVRQTAAVSDETAMRIAGFQNELDLHFDTIEQLICQGKKELYQAENIYTKETIIKSVLKNGSDCVKCVSYGENSFQLRFDLKNLSGKYEGIVYYLYPFIVEEAVAFENGALADVELKESITDECKMFKGACVFEIKSKEQLHALSHIELNIKIRDIRDEYTGMLETYLQNARLQNAENKQQIIWLEQENQTKQNQIIRLEELYQKLEQENLNRQERIVGLEELYKKLEQENLNKKGHIELLLESDRELDRIKISRTWRLACVFQKASSLLVPVGSIRRLFLKLSMRLVCHPVQSIKMLSPRKIRHFFYFLHEEGPGFVSRRIDESMQGAALEKTQLDVRDDLENKQLEDYEHLVFPYTENPDVSMIIPVYNQFPYTYHCLKSLLEHTGNTYGYEIIVADDNSTDDTVRLHEIAENIRIIKNKENMRFLKNCCHAAESARGRYILFLNNDTQVQKDWLEPLIRLMESTSKAGIVGSKLVYPDGTLQEAGGIVWKDASAWNYGNRSDPENPEFNYVKEADYISGACIMIRASLWKEIGGFDQTFAPAYYEDTDLAFEIRKRGYKVYYQPLSVVVHFEGASNGTDLTEGQKYYQVQNREKFYEKWKDVLSDEHYENGSRVFAARDRSSGKKTLLIIDHYVPLYDKDAGSRCMYHYVKFFLRMGYQVKFIGDNFFRHEPYTTTLQQMGVEVLYGKYYSSSWKEWIRSNAAFIDYVILSRPHISIKYIDFIRSHTNAKIIYFGHDLHYLRMTREYELSGNVQARTDAREWKKLELELMRKADISYYFSQAELSEIAKLDTDVKVRRVPIYIYQQIPDVNYKADSRKDILFVGGFGHPPNVDAVRWLKEAIMPNVWKYNQDIRLHVVGSNPTQEIRDFAGSNLVIHGFVTDEELEKIYQSIKLAIVPLRYGAGIKGKIIEGMMRGIPLVTTSIGIEGIEGAENIVEVSDDALGLAEGILRLYDDVQKLECMAEEEHRYIVAHYSLENAVDILKEDFAFFEL